MHSDHSQKQANLDRLIRTTTLCGLILGLLSACSASSDSDATAGGVWGDAGSQGGAAGSGSDAGGSSAGGAAGVAGQGGHDGGGKVDTDGGTAGGTNVDSGTDAQTDSSTADTSIDGDSGPMEACTSNAQCDDGFFCNGKESCEPGHIDADAKGCRKLAAPCISLDMCLESENRCKDACDTDSDLDNDGVPAKACGGKDCDDHSAEVHPGATEICNERDDNCDGKIDEGVLAVCYPDADGDSYAVKGAVGLLKCRDSKGQCGVGFTSREPLDDKNVDCNDAQKSTNPGATELCNNKTDDDCDGLKDEDCTTCYFDADGDGYGDPGTIIIATGSCPTSKWSLKGGDCCDKDVKTYPGAKGFFTTANACKSFDYNCDGTQSQQFTKTGGGGCVFNGVCTSKSPDAWVGTTVPACGEKGQMVPMCQSQVAPNNCVEQKTAPVQGCN